jgi:rifampicin phosphotransferase
MTCRAPGRRVNTACAGVTAVSATVVAVMDAHSIEPYPDGRWWVIDHRPSKRFPLYCRGNTGEVYPNIVSPLTGSIVNVPFARGQARMALELGMATKAHLAEFDGVTSSVTGVFGGYLYGNVSLARSAVLRTPGLTVDMVDQQMYGLTGAPPMKPGPGDRDPRAVVRSMRTMGSAMLRPRSDVLESNQRLITDYLARAPAIDEASDYELIELGPALAPFLEQMMYSLIVASAFSAVGRSILERIVEPSGADGIVNRLTAGLGTIESAEPAVDLWALGRLVHDDALLTSMFDAGLNELDDRLRGASSENSVGSFLARFAEFERRHGARGPDEWELASPTWGSEPSIALAVIDRLRRAPADRDPIVVGARLADERTSLIDQTRASLGFAKRRAFDIGVRASAIYGAQREATKAALVRMLNPTRRGLAELARRSGIAHHDLFLLTIDEVRQALVDSARFDSARFDPAQFDTVIVERRTRRDFLQARVPPFWFEDEMPSPMSWSLRVDVRQPVEHARVIHGIGVCAGVATGTARVVTDPTKPGELEPGDILIAPLTDPAWTPLFLAAAGVVVDVGAQQSHAAIVARELGIPTVVSAEGASSTIPDGALVTVDGSAGSVTVHAPS